MQHSALFFPSSQGEAPGTPAAVKGVTEGRRSEPLTARTFRDNGDGRKDWTASPASMPGVVQAEAGFDSLDADVESIHAFREVRHVGVH